MRYLVEYSDGNSPNTKLYLNKFPETFGSNWECHKDKGLSGSLLFVRYLRRQTEKIYKDNKIHSKIVII